MSRDDELKALAAKIEAGELRGGALMDALMQLSAAEDEPSPAAAPEMSEDASQDAAVAASSDDATLSVAEVKAIAKETGEPQPHPTLPNVRIKPSGKLHPALGYAWVDPYAAGDFRVKKKTEAPKKKTEAPKKKTIAEVKAIAKETGEPQSHPTFPNVCIKPNGYLSPALGYTWVDSNASGEERFRVRKKNTAELNADATIKARALAKKTGKNVKHPVYPNVLLRPDERIMPAPGYEWVKSDSTDKRVRKKPTPKKRVAAKKKPAQTSRFSAPAKKKPAQTSRFSRTVHKPLSQMPRVEGPVSGPGGFFTSVGLYRVQFFLKTFDHRSPGVLVAASGPVNAIAALFRDIQTQTISLSWHNPSLQTEQIRPRNDLQSILYEGSGELEASSAIYEDLDIGDYTPILTADSDVVGLDIYSAMPKGLVRVTQITSRAQLSKAERSGYLPFNTTSDDDYAEAYI